MAYDFTWPGGGSIKSALNFSKDAFCITNLGIEGMPANVTNTYTENNAGSTSCAPMLGDRCVIAITNTIGSLPGEGGCYSSLESFYTLPECASTLGYAYSQTPRHRALIETTNLNSNSSSDSHLSGAAVWGSLTDASNGTNTSNYEAVVNQLQIIMITPVVNGFRPTPQLLCMRVNTSQLVEIGVNTSQGNGGGGSDASGESLAKSLQYRSGAGIAVILGWVVIFVAYIV
jgi:hypothetical protein